MNNSPDLKEEKFYDCKEMMLLALRGIFVALDLIESGNLDASGQMEGDEARHELIIAGRALASAAVDRF
jgi:hypothetical protein